MSMVRMHSVGGICELDGTVDAGGQLLLGTDREAGTISEIASITDCALPARLSGNARSYIALLPFARFRSLNAMNKREDVEKAYQLQLEAGVRGFAQWGAVGAGLAAIAHHQWPAFRYVRPAHRSRGCYSGRNRRQTLPFKAWMVTIGTWQAAWCHAFQTPDVRPPLPPSVTLKHGLLTRTIC